MDYRKTYLEVSIKNILTNYHIYDKYVNKDIFVVTKANAYGHGMLEVSKAFEKINVKYICTATLDEAITLRENNIKSPILVMGYTHPNDIAIAKKHNITLTITSVNDAKIINESNIKDLLLHIKVNTSMNRLGVDNLDDVLEIINLLKDNNIEGIFTHYCCVEKIEEDFINFKKIVNQTNFNFKYIHASSSNSALSLKEDFTNAVRIGVGLYGGINSHNLKPTAKLYSEVVSIRMINKRSSVSYDGLFIAEEDTLIATIPIGYGDGVLRSDKNNYVFVNNKKYPIIGNICMDQLMIKVDEDVSLFDKVEFFGDNISIFDIAKNRNTIYYEIITLISNRVYRKYKY